MKKAFTLSEMLICITIMAALVVLFLSTTHAKPNSNMVMFRKAYNITSTNVYEMLQTAAYYETGLLNDLAKTSEKIEDEYPQGSQKFCKIFASFLNTAGDVDCSKGGKTPTFTTLDGITWYLPPKTTSGNFSGTETITVDVNGAENPPNCKAVSSECKTPD
ncbi:MAG: prepilin-type N-terminal cleavage/methylation domain-containing protein, partial [Candidatus Gastranaerophilales bacterium]|nr:prepilin-type N-terminal cleavage/methylation domain-containing protein [Candidatus Gastranaerophilales bacterium]